MGYLPSKMTRIWHYYMYLVSILDGDDNPVETTANINSSSSYRHLRLTTRIHAPHEMISLSMILYLLRAVQTGCYSSSRILEPSLALRILSHSHVSPRELRSKKTAIVCKIVACSECTPRSLFASSSKNGMQMGAAGGVQEAQFCPTGASKWV